MGDWAANDTLFNAAVWVLVIAYFAVILALIYRMG